jgi:hypothetical protein
VFIVLLFLSLKYSGVDLTNGQTQPTPSHLSTNATSLSLSKSVLSVSLSIPLALFPTILISHKYLADLMYVYH